MADEKHLKLLLKGVEIWNQWRKENPDIMPNLFRANLFGINLFRADLSNANLCAANLSSANLLRSNLFCANLCAANLSSANLLRADLFRADLRSADLSNAKLIRADLRSANLSDANLFRANLFRADLLRANLSSAKLYSSILRNANLRSANLSSAKLYSTNLGQVNTLASNFEDATFTGACIEDWNINSKTNLKNVKCDYIYLKGNYSLEENQWIISDRRPHNGIFKKGEFAQLFQKALETVDLIFSEGIEWTAFLESFQQLQEEVKSEELSIQAIEKKTGGAFVVRLEVPEGANKAEIEKYIKQEYEAKLTAIEAAYQKQLQAKDETIKAKNETIQTIKDKGTNLLEMARLMSQNQQKNIIEINSTMRTGDTYNQSGNIGIGHNEGAIKDNAKVAGVINEVEKQNLAEAVQEIQQLLE